MKDNNSPMKPEEVGGKIIVQNHKCNASLLPSSSEDAKGGGSE